MSRSCILLCSGCGTRCGLGFNKVLYEINNIPLFMYSLKTLYEASFDEIIIVVNSVDLSKVFNYLDGTIYQDVILVEGGDTRMDSVKKGLAKVSSDYVFIHDSARPYLSINDLNNLISISSSYLVGTMYSKCYDTVRMNKDILTTLDRDKLLNISTPQFFHKSLYDKILQNTLNITDEISLFEDLEVGLLEVSFNQKVTTKEDLEYAKYYLSSKFDIVIGHSLDYHPYSNEGSLILSGVTFNDFPRLLGHSDADVVYHSVCEAIMGATSLGDLGTLYPDTSDEFKGISSSYFIKDVMNRISNTYKVINIDVMVYCLTPKLTSYKGIMAKNIMDLTNALNVTVKACTLNKEGLIALNKGIGAEAVVLLKKNIK